MEYQRQKRNNYVIYTILPDGKYLVWNLGGTGDKVSTYKQLRDKDNKYQMMSGYEKTMKDDKGNEIKYVDKECLLNYVKDFHKWKKELETLDVKYTEYFNDLSVAKNTFHRNASKFHILGSVKEGRDYKFIGHDEIDFIEYRWIHACKNGGLMYFNKKYEHKTKQSYGYDFNMCYPRLLGETGVNIPTKKGKEVILTTVPDIDNVPMGYYHVMISSTLPRMKKLLSFNKSHTYTSTDLQWVLERKRISDKKDETAITITLIEDGMPNAYIYDKDDLVNTKDIGFKRWLEQIIKMRKKFPGNKLIKMLAKSVWGCMTQRHTTKLPREEILKNNLSITTTNKFGYLVNPNADFVALNQKFNFVLDNETGIYTPCEGNTKLLYVHKPMIYNIRIKAFLTSLARIQIAKVALHDLKHVLRIQTDNVVFTQPQDFGDKFPTLLPEDKTTGKITWHNVNHYKKIE